MKILIAALIAVSAFGQGKQSVTRTGVTDDSGLTWLAPSSTYASRPGSPVPKQVWIMTDKLCDGTGSGPANCRWNGSTWESIGGGGGGGSSPLTTKGDIYTYSTTNARRAVGANGLFLVADSTDPTGLNWTSGPAGYTCTHNTVTASTLSGLGTGAAKEVTILSSVPGTTRFDQVLVSESVLFTGTTGLTVSMGRTGVSTNYEFIPDTALMVSAGDVNFFSARPIPPQLTTTYDLVLNFKVTSGNVSAASAGTAYWEVCSYVR